MHPTPRIVRIRVDIAGLPNVAPELRRVGGVARITRQLFYLPDGRSPQLTGVKSDLALPSYRYPDLETEDTLPHALPALSIAPPESLPERPPEIARLTPALRQELRARSERRQVALPEFNLRRRSTEHYNGWWATTVVPLSLEQRRRQQADRDDTRNRLRAEARRLGEQTAFPYRRFDLAAREAHQRVLRARRTAAGAPCVNCYDAGIFYYQAGADEPIYDIPLSALDLEECRTASADLAAAWTSATGVALPPEGVRAILADLGEQQAHPETARPLEELFRRRLAETVDEPTLARGLAAFCRAAVELAPRLVSDLRELDVPLRESLRLATDWAELAPPAAPVPPPSPTPPAATP